MFIFGLLIGCGLTYAYYRSHVRFVDRVSHAWTEANVTNYQGFHKAVDEELTRLGR